MHFLVRQGTRISLLPRPCRVTAKGWDGEERLRSYHIKETKPEVAAGGQPGRGNTIAAYIRLGVCGSMILHRFDICKIPR